MNRISRAVGLGGVASIAAIVLGLEPESAGAAVQTAPPKAAAAAAPKAETPKAEAAKGPSTPPAAKPEAAKPEAPKTEAAATAQAPAAAAAAPVPDPGTEVPTPFSIRYMMRDMEVIATVLELDSVQVSIVESMLSDYLAATSVSRPVTEYPALAEEFRSNVQAVLSEEQYARWPQVDAAVRRSRLAIGATLPGEGIDVIGLTSGLLESHERSGRDFIAASQDYSAALDPLLARRTELLDALRLGASRGTSAETLRSLMDEVAPLRMAIRDLNERTLEHLATLVSAERGAMLRDKMIRTMYPSVYSAGEAESLVRRAREEVGASAEDQTRIDTIASALESRLQDARAGAIRAVRTRSEFAAGARGSWSSEQVDEMIKGSEKELMEVDDWVIDTLLVEMPESSTLGIDLRAMIENRDRYKRLKESNGWGNPDATLREFDLNGDGVLDGGEADNVFRTYTRNVSRFAKYRL